MDKDIKDYLHLYVHHTVKFIGKDRFFIKNGDLIQLMPSDIDRFTDKNEFNLILRPISDISESEEVEVANIIGVISATNFIEAWKKKSSYNINVHDTIELFHYLLKRGFDLFGLIESGLVIDSTTLSKHTNNK